MEPPREVAIPAAELQRWRALIKIALMSWPMTSDRTARTALLLTAEAIDRALVLPNTRNGDMAS